jgi:hypothetical protein
VLCPRISLRVGDRNGDEGMTGYRRRETSALPRTGASASAEPDACFRDKAQVGIRCVRREERSSVGCRCLTSERPLRE